MHQEVSREQRQPRILVIDDDDVIRTMLSAALRDEGLTVDLAANGLEGLERVRQHRPSVIVLDLVMPIMDGLDFIEGCRALRLGQTIPLVVMASTDELIHAREPLHPKGGIAVVTKPFELETMTAIVLPLARRQAPQQPR
jgi:CheY-like chemotaxis protein